MVELRAIHLSAPEPLRLHRGSKALAETSLRPLVRGLIFLAALSLPVLGCTVADWFHGGAPRSMQVAAASLTPPQSRAAAKLSPTTTTRVPSRQALPMPVKFGQSLSLQ